MKSIIFILFVTQLFAVESEIQVQSCGGVLNPPYICNAGITHNPHPGKTCVYPDSKLPCNPLEDNCECSATESDHVGDELRGFPSFRILAAPQGPGSVYPMTGDPFANTPLEDLSFFLSSEVYGAKYFIDICYPDPGFLPEGNYSTLITNTNFFPDATSYIPLARPNYHYYSPVEYSGEGIISCLPPGDFTGSWMSSNGHTPSWFLGEGERCVVRYEMSEETQFLRKWQKQTSRFVFKPICPERPERGCTYTIGYWKTHPNQGGRGGEGWDFLSDGQNTLFLNSNNIMVPNRTWFEMFHIEDPNPSTYAVMAPYLENWKRKYFNLSHQYMGAHLNFLSGATIFSVQHSYDRARELLEKFMALDDFFPPSEAEMRELENAHVTLDSYNNGEVGPGHCD